MGILDISNIGEWFQKFQENRYKSHDQNFNKQKNSSIYKRF